MRRLSMTALFMVALAAVSANALEVNQPEIQSVGGEAIQFENYTGPHKTIDSVESIQAIGSGLGQTVSRSVQTAGTFSLNGKYSVIHAVDTATKEKLDADILVIGEDAAVDHITNLRRIIASYLSAAYGYSQKDASTIATFVTVYNAVYRGRMDVFRDRYKAVVTDNLSADKCGLSTKWSDWPGKSQIVIPLSDLSGGLSTVDTSTISDKDVIDSMREDDDMGIGDRKDMVDLKEREAEEAEQRAEEAQKAADDAQKAADDAQKAADDAQKAADDAQKAADDAQKAADDAQKAADEAPGDTKKQEEAEEAQKAADDAQKAADDARQEADDAQKAADDAQKAADDAQQEADDYQEQADKKNEEAQEERSDIAQDQREVIERTQDGSQDSLNTVIGLTSTTGTYSQMVKVDADRGTLVKGSPVTVIRGKTILPAGTVSVTDASGNQKSTTAYMAVCGTESGTGTVKLCLLDGENMEIQAESTETLAENSALVQSGSDYYCVINDGGTYVLGKYDAKLKLQQKGTVPVSKETPITVTQKGIVVTSPQGAPLLLKASDLSRVTE